MLTKFAHKVRLFRQTLATRQINLSTRLLRHDHPPNTNTSFEAMKTCFSSLASFPLSSTRSKAHQQEAARCGSSTLHHKKGRTLASMLLVLLLFSFFNHAFESTTKRVVPAADSARAHEEGRAKQQVTHFQRYPMLRETNKIKLLFPTSIPPDVVSCIRAMCVVMLMCV